nr:MAG TPA: hypothetical protein [Caudoviricetes sp.]
MGVYIILNKTKSSEDELIIKIGCSKCIQKRFKQIKSSFKFNGNMDELELFQVIKCEKYRLLEKHLHMVMNSKRITNEWFKTDEEFLNKALMKIDLSYYR